MTRRQSTDHAARPASLDPSAVRRRRRVVVTTAVGGTLLSLVALKCVLTVGATHLGMKAWEDGDPVAAERFFAAAEHVNVAERWIAPYNSGVALAGQGRWKEAEDLFAKARETVPPDALCRVVLNQVISIEAQGDALERTDDTQGAQTKYRQAELVLADAEGCSAEEPDSGGEGEGEQDEPQQSEAAETEGQASPEGEPGSEGEDQGEGEGQGEGSGSGQGPQSEQEQVEAASSRLAEKTGRTPSKPTEKPTEEPTEQQAERLAERMQEGARQSNSGQPSSGQPATESQAGTPGGSPQQGRTW